jgi:hypothetical protein
VKSGTPVELRLAETISSAKTHKGDRVEFVVVKDVVVDGYTVIRSGALARGSVTGVKGKRHLGMGGNVKIKLDSVELTTGQSAGLALRRRFKGRSRILRMGLEMAVTAVIYWPAVPVFLLSRGQESTVLKGSEVTAYTKGDSPVETEDLSRSRNSGSELSEMVNLLPPRVLNGEGREGDMLNLIFLAREDDLQGAFARAGWLEADKSIPRIVWRLLWRRMHYKQLPMDRLYVFGRAQDYSYVLPDPRLIVARRHHVRIWRTNREVDGVPLWVGAATHDVSIKVVKHKFRPFHRIDPNVDAERDFIANSLAKTWQPIREESVQRAEPVLSARTATGQRYYSDGKMLLLELIQKTPPLPGTAEVAVNLRLSSGTPEFKQ